MLGIDVPPAVMAEIEEVMTSTTEKVLRLRSTHGQMFSEPSQGDRLGDVAGVSCACRFCKTHPLTHRP